MSEMKTTLIVNGEERVVHAPGHHTLLRVLRGEELNLTGAKSACGDVGQCGTCTVLVDGAAVRSCFTFPGDVAGKSIVTIEGQSADPIGARLIDGILVSYASQCGFCVPGVINQIMELFRQNPTLEEPHVSRDELRTWFTHCRCSGYEQFLDGIEIAAGRRQPRVHDSDHEVLGRSMPRVHGRERCDGGANFTGDFHFPNMLHAVCVRSPHAHARIRDVDVSGALAFDDGVVDAVRAEDFILPGEKGPRRAGVVQWTLDEPPLGWLRVRQVGEAFAVVAAETPELALVASRLVNANFTPLPSYITPKEALAPDAIPIHPVRRKMVNGKVYAKRVPTGNPSRPPNMFKAFELPRRGEEFGDTKAALNDAKVRMRADWRFTATNHLSMERPCVVAIWHEDREVLEVYYSTQVSYYTAKWLAWILGLRPEQVHVICDFLGAGYGFNSEPHFHIIASAAKLAMRTGRPVRLEITREEMFIIHRGRHDITFDYEMGLDADGRIVAVRADALLNKGAYPSFGTVTPYYALQISTGPYRIPNFAASARSVFTNCPASGAMRAHGTVQNNPARDVTLSILAERLKMDPIEVRRINAMESGEETVNGFLLPSSGLVECLNWAEQASDWKHRRANPTPGYGLGVSSGLYLGGGTAYAIDPAEHIQSVVDLGFENGKLHLRTGEDEIGQGSDTAFSAIASEILGFPMRLIKVTSARTAETGRGLGSYSSRVTFMGGEATKMSAEALRSELVCLMAERWGVDPDQVEVSQNGYRSGDHHISPEDLIMLAHEIDATSQGHYETREAGSGAYAGGRIGASPTYSICAAVVLAHVDTETGIVRTEKVWIAHDCGFAINPDAVIGQINGSAHMGEDEARKSEHKIGDGCFESAVGAGRGIVVAPDMLDYNMLTPRDSPVIISHVVESAKDRGVDGRQEAGQGSLLPLSGALVNAIRNATGGAVVHTVPTTPTRVLEAITAMDGGAS